MWALFADHVWQSTLFTGGVALLVCLCRSNRAQVRHWLWFAASAKFLVPFAALVSLGGSLEWLPPPSLVPTSTSAFIALVGEPFASPADIAAGPMQTAAPESSWWPLAAVIVWAFGCAAVLVTWLVRWRHAARVARQAQPLHSGRAYDTLRRVQALAGVRAPIALAASHGSFEPCVFGIRRPLLLWPGAIDEQLNDRHVEAVVAHEVAHVRRHDNATALVHMVVAAVFWFHPLVWWIGTRLIVERERACDEDVIEMGSRPEVYAESILRTCRFCVESPMACIAGISGADLRRRIAAILHGVSPQPLGVLRKGVVVAAAALAIGLPVVVGAIDQTPAPRSSVPVGIRFETASVKRADPNERGRVFGFTLETGRLRLVNLTLDSIVRAAYGVEFPHSIPMERMSGGPEWMASDRFTIEATAGRAVTPGEMAGMLRTLLAERFTLVTRVEPREQAVFHLIPVTPGRLGPKLRKSDVDCKTAARCGIGGGPGRMLLSASPMSLLAETLNELTDRPVFDRSGFEGSFDGALEWAPAPEELLHFGGPDASAAARAPEPGVSIYTALQEQFGLRLVSTRGPVDFLVIVGASHPSEN